MISLRSLYYAFVPLFLLRVLGKSMEPTFYEKETLLVLNKRYTSFRINDICICTDPRTKKLIVKRIGKITGRKYYVIGDNRRESTDSRTFGWIDKKNLLGKVIYPQIR